MAKNPIIYLLVSEQTALANCIAELFKDRALLAPMEFNGRRKGPIIWKLVP